MHPLQWLGRRDRDLAALRRAGRAAIVMPAMFALGDRVIANPIVATFAAFGSFSMLLLVDFGGPLRERLQAQATLAVAVLRTGVPWHAGLAQRLARGPRDDARRLRRDLHRRRQLRARRRGHLVAALLHPAGDPCRARLLDTGPRGRMGNGGRSLADRRRRPVADAPAGAAAHRCDRRLRGTRRRIAGGGRVRLHRPDGDARARARSRCSSKPTRRSRRCTASSSPRRTGPPA